MISEVKINFWENILYFKFEKKEIEKEIEKKQLCHTSE